MRKPKIFEIATEFEMQAWLSGRLTNSKPAERAAREKIERGTLYAERFETLRDNGLWEATRKFLRFYIENCVFLYAKTECRWWSLHVASVDNLKLCVGPQQIFEASLKAQPVFEFYLRKSLLSERTRSEMATLFDCEFTSPDLENPSDIRKDQIRMVTEGPRFFGYFYSSPDLISNCRSFNAGIMQEQRNKWWKNHCYEASNSIFAPV